mmetsp:Transcript_49115/g.114881  ORF Transcript_49115/g.114881 Transcript_49115/m.114881 type:complete len:240 (-) Transcript_49115:6343-7062(-)
MASTTVGCACNWFRSFSSISIMAQKSFILFRLMADAIDSTLSTPSVHKYETCTSREKVTGRRVQSISVFERMCNRTSAESLPIRELVTRAKAFPLASSEARCMEVDIWSKKNSTSRGSGSVVLSRIASMHRCKPTLVRTTSAIFTPRRFLSKCAKIVAPMPVLPGASKAGSSPFLVSSSCRVLHNILHMDSLIAASIGLRLVPLECLFTSALARTSAVAMSRSSALTAAKSGVCCSTSP